MPYTVATIRIFVTLLQPFQGQTLINLANCYAVTMAIIFIIKTDTRTKSVPVHTDISVLKHHCLILTKLKCSTWAAGNSWLHPLPSYNNRQNKHSKDSYYSIISSLVDTYYCLIWASFESVVLNTGPGVILTSAVLRTARTAGLACVCIQKMLIG